MHPDARDPIARQDGREGRVGKTGAARLSAERIAALREGRGRVVPTGMVVVRIELMRGVGRPVHAIMRDPMCRRSGARGGQHDREGEGQYDA